MWNTEFAIRSFFILRARFLCQNISTMTNLAYGSSMTGPGVASSETNQLASGSMAPVFYFYNGYPKRPSLFMGHTVARFEKSITECCQSFEEVGQLAMMDTDRISPSTLESFPQLLRDIHDFSIHVAAKVRWLCLIILQAISFLIFDILVILPSNLELNTSKYCSISCFSIETQPVDCI